MENNTNKFERVFFVLFLIFFVFIIGSGVNVKLDHDDFYFSHVLDSSNLIDFLGHRYQEWSGRTAIEMIMVTTISHSLIWKAAIPISIVLMAYSIWSISLRSAINFKFGIPIVIIIILSIPALVSADAMWWISGFYNYLLPVSCGLYAFNIFKRCNEVGLPQKIITLPLLILAASAEQTALFLSASFIILITSRKELTRYSFLYIMVVAITALSLFLSPGNHIRYIVESSRYMPEIYTYDFFQKISFGMDRLYNHLEGESNILFISSLIIALVYCWVSVSVSSVQKNIAILIISIYLVLHFTSQMQGVNLIKYLDNNLDFGASQWPLISTYTTYLFTLMTMCSMLYISLIPDSTYHVDYTPFFSLVLSLGLTLAIGISPTVYASGYRVLFIFDVGVVIYITGLLNKIFRCISVNHMVFLKK